MYAPVIADSALGRSGSAERGKNEGEGLHYSGKKSRKEGRKRRWKESRGGRGDLKSEDSGLKISR